MIYSLFLIGIGIGLGCSIAASTTSKIGDTTRTQYIRPILGYNVGWYYDSSPHDYKITITIFKPQKQKFFNIF